MSGELRAAGRSGRREAPAACPVWCQNGNECETSFTMIPNPILRHRRPAQVWLLEYVTAAPRLSRTAQRNRATSYNRSPRQKRRRALYARPRVGVPRRAPRASAFAGAASSATACRSSAPPPPPPPSLPPPATYAPSSSSSNPSAAVSAAPPELLPPTAMWGLASQLLQAASATPPVAVKPDGRGGGPTDEMATRRMATASEGVENGARHAA